jgi:hypothetical protein
MGISPHRKAIAKCGPLCHGSAMDLLFAAISGEAVVNALIWLVIGALIFFVVNWGLTKIALPEPFNKIATVLLVLLVVVIIVNGLLTLAGHPIIKW